MNIGERIKNRRKELELSVDDVADKLGKNRATVYRYESSDIENLPITILEPLSRILKTTPDYLMGWITEKELPNKEQSITDKEKELLTNYNKLNDNGKRKLIEYSNDLIGNQRYSLSSDMRYGQIPLFDEIEEEKDYLKPIAAHGSMTENNIIDPRDLELAKKKKQVKR